jgi:hypothetical protein
MYDTDSNLELSEFLASLMGFARSVELRRNWFPSLTVKMANDIFKKADLLGLYREYFHFSGIDAVRELLNRVPDDGSIDDYDDEFLRGPNRSFPRLMMETSATWEPSQTSDASSPT